jgi:glutathione S-transferase
MRFTLYLHPLASFCHKVLVALYENDVPFASVTVDLGDPGEAAMHLARWPVGKIPVLHDDAERRIVPETSIIIEYLEDHAPGPVPMLPADPDARREARLWDRFFDNYVAVPMQKIVLDRIRPGDGRDPLGVAEARAALDTAYAMIDGQLATRPWAAGESFTLADCAAAPALFFASIVHPIPEVHASTHAYLERLLARPSFARVLAEARPWFHLFPYRDAMPARYLVP